MTRPAGRLKGNPKKCVAPSTSVPEYVLATSTGVSSVNHPCPPRNIFLEGKTSKMSHSNPGIVNLYFLHSWSFHADAGADTPRESLPNPTSTSSNCGGVFI